MPAYCFNSSSVVIYNSESLLQCNSSDSMNDHRALGRGKLLKFLEMRKFKKLNRKIKLSISDVRKIMLTL